ncbi:MAG: undecaprenyl-diphosphate phosphatase [Desulfobacterales bacterium]|nr:undecaprenyl-diphosphate phosphatase [Desulfobacterales bacterium]
MTTLQAIALGIIQGLTEFLPVSSSGHLVILQNLFGFKEPELFFDISLHLGTLVATCLVFFREIRSVLQVVLTLPGLIRCPGDLKQLYGENEPFRLAVLICAASVPTAILGFFFHNIAEQLFGSVGMVGVMLLVTGGFLWASRLSRPEGRPILQVTLTDALLIGLVQGIAVIPGISRSGSTISIALLLGIHRMVAGRFSFLMSIPAILGAVVLEFEIPQGPGAVSLQMVLLGTAFAGIVGYAALKILLRVIQQGHLYWFALYCWLLGGVTLALNYF